MYFHEVKVINQANVDSQYEKKVYYDAETYIEKELKRCKDKTTIWKEAIKREDLIVLQVMIKNKLIDINKLRFAVDYTDSRQLVFYDMTSLYYAAFKKLQDVVRLFLLHDADVTLKVSGNSSSTAPLAGKLGSKDFSLTVLEDSNIKESIKNLIQKELSTASSEAKIQPVGP